MGPKTQLVPQFPPAGGSSSDDRSRLRIREITESSQMYFLTLMIQRPLPDTPDDDILAGNKALTVSANINPLGRSSVIPEGQ